MNEKCGVCFNDPCDCKDLFQPYNAMMKNEFQQKRYQITNLMFQIRHAETMFDFAQTLLEAAQKQFHDCISDYIVGSDDENRATRSRSRTRRARRAERDLLGSIGQRSPSRGEEDSDSSFLYPGTNCNPEYPSPERASGPTRGDSASDRRESDPGDTPIGKAGSPPGFFDGESP